ncbi:porin [Psychromonas sp. psych-6C06]|uniref:porin n=1 Tax=Psychromonas sp. psych-6C06 TaxID=2058089 RepID=UPI000C34333B|nr:porin [Psychromonas sp. psych-6C06]PKF60750.1 porin [Psychromonas sp. psych-6C06]
MKKTLLATAILSGLVSATAGAATVYDNDGTTMKIGGRAEVRGEFVDTGDQTVKDKSRARINFNGKTQISENLTGFGFMEYEIKPDSSLSNRYLFAGFGTQVGDFSYGKQDTSNVQISDMTDIASVHSGIQQIADSSSDKQSNTFLYSGTFADALTVQANFTADDADSDEDAYGISALYGFDFGLDLGASFSSQDEFDQATLGAAYTLDKLYVAATYAMGSADANNDFTSLEATVQYKFTKEFRLIGMLGMADVEDTDTEDFFALEAQYRFNKSIRTYISYAVNNLDGAEDSLVAGIRYNF